MTFFKLPPHLVKILDSYLSNRTFFIQNGELKSTAHPVFSALPQGSILSPILFSAFINDVSEALQVPFVLYADDLVFHVSGQNAEDLIRDAEKTLLKLHLWFSEQGLLINFAKTKCMLFKKSKDRFQDEFDFIQCQNEKIERVFVFKYLGMILDPSLSFKSHATHVVNKTASAVCKMHTLKRFLPITAFQVLVNAFVHSIADFSLAIWGAVGETELEKVQKQVNKLLYSYFYSRLANKRKLKARNVDCNYMLATCNFYTVQERYCTALVKFLLKSKFVTLQLPDMQNWFLFSENNRSSRVLPLLKVPIYVSKTSSLSVKCSAIKYWNSLPKSWELNVKQPFAIISNLKKLLISQRSPTFM